MPMDDYTHYHGASNALLNTDAISELRFALIGNNDLKLRLVTDEGFLGWFSKQLLSGLDSLVAADTPTLLIVNDLNVRILVLRMLVTFAGSKSQPPLVDGVDVAKLRFCVPLLSDLLKYVLDSFLPRVMDPSAADQTDNAEVAEITDVIDTVVCDSFHVILVLANALKLALEDVRFDSIMRLVTTLMVLADGPISKGSLKMEKVLITGLEMIPYCLERGPHERMETYAEGLLAVSLTRLFNELLLMGSLADEDNTNIDVILPNSDADMNRLTALVVAVVQILNYFGGSGRREVLPIEREFFTSSATYKSVLYLLKYEDNKLMNVAALNLIRFYFTFMDDANPSVKTVNLIFEKLFPRIIELLDYDYSASNDQPNPRYIQLPVTILSDLCLKNPEICDHLRNTNVDIRMMNELENLFSQVHLFRQLHALKSAAQNTSKLADFTILRKSTPELESTESLNLLLVQSLQLDMISNYLLLLGVFTSSSEEFRRRITSYKSDKNSHSGPNFLCLMIFEIMDDFRFLVTQTLMSYNTFAQLQQLTIVDEVFLTWFGSNIGVLFTLLENSIFSNTLYLLRSLSRSVATLRTFFVDLNSVKSVLDAESQVSEYLTLDPLKHSESIVDIVSAGYDREISFDRKGSFVTSMLEILSLLEDVHVVKEYFVSVKNDVDNQRILSRKSLCVKKVMLLGSIANFGLDFSSFRAGIINHENFLKDLAHINMNAIEAKRAYDYSEFKDVAARDSIFEQLKVQLGVFKVLKNYLYNETEENKAIVWEFFPLSLIYEKSLYGIVDEWEEDPEIHKLFLEHKVIAFGIMRNLAAASTYFSEDIKNSYLKYAKEKHDNGQLYVPQSWNDYLHDNIMCYDLFVDLQGDENSLEKKFFNDDEFLLRLILDEQYFNLVVNICYLEGNRYANITEFRRSDFPRSNFLDVWKRLLEVKLLYKLEARICGLNEKDRVNLSTLLCKVKLAVTWILVNLTYIEQAHGYQLSDKISFGLFDTVTSSQASHTASGSNRLLTPSNIVIEESDEEEEEDEEEQDHQANNQESTTLEENGLLTQLDRAKLLNKHGFTDVLENLIYDMSTPKYEVAKSKERSSLERFDNVNANSLYEKCKTSHQQIVSLLAGTSDDAGKKFRNQQYPKSKRTHPLRRASNVSWSQREFYGTSQERLGQVGRSQGEQQERNNEEAVVDGDEEEDFDEPWIR
ncbi:CIC11C00000003096 [Sungouiella intermedia]|uniref:CIC11C00000003096 n=1 Tax=Sungouiella intermedia TaxID=45354 RepID=A0A1L0C0Y5_9ASCO|nr:CIC11C00000003096 [[Candida] intermedia]